MSSENSVERVIWSHGHPMIPGVCKPRDEAEALARNFSVTWDKVLNFTEPISSPVKLEEQQHTLYQVVMRIK